MANDVFAENTGNTLPHTHLKEKWLWPARLLWLFGIAMAFTIFLSVTIAKASNPEAIALSRTWFGFEPGQDWLGWTHFIFTPLIFSLAAFFIVWQRPRDWMALLVSYALVGLGTTVVQDVEFIAPQIFPRMRLLVAFSELNIMVALQFMLFLFPEGRFRPTWLKWLSVLIIITGLPASYFSVGMDALSLQMRPLVISIYLVLVITGIGSQIYRYRHISTPIQRQQTKWVVVGFILPLLNTVVWVLIYLGRIIDDPPTIISIPLLIAFIVFSPLLPFSFILSILRFRLWDIDYVINRSLVYGTLTILLLAVFGGSFTLMRALLESVLGSDQVLLAVAVPAVAVTALFNPARRTLRRFVDRRFYGIQIDYATPARHIPVIIDSSLTHIGNYINLEFIGSGGMAEVYRGVHPTLNVPVAVKVLPHKLAQKEEFRRRFEREARVVADLKHPNIVQMHDFGVEDGTSYMAMEYIEGTDLSQMITTRGRIPLDEAHAILRQIAAALDYAHEQGLVHRDIKPSNVMVDGSGRAVLMDFGIARIQTAMTQLTGTGGMVGTLDYIAPEQIHGASDVDGRADVYSLGVMTYQMLAGELPFRKANPGALVMAHLMEPPPDVRDSAPELPEGVAEAIIRAMAKRPEERFSAAGEMAATIRRVNDNSR